MVNEKRLTETYEGFKRELLKVLPGVVARVDGCDDEFRTEMAAEILKHCDQAFTTDECTSCAAGSSICALNFEPKLQPLLETYEKELFYNAIEERDNKEIALRRKKIVKKLNFNMERKGFATTEQKLAYLMIKLKQANRKIEMLQSLLNE